MDTASLKNLYDIVMPTPVSLWPPALGIQLILILGLLWTCIGGAVWWMRWRRNAYRRVALRELTVFAEQIHDKKKSRVEAVRGLSILLKRVALAAYPRDEVATLSGSKWLDFLEGTGGGEEFTSGPGRTMASVLYQDQPEKALNDSEFERLIHLSRNWIRRHRQPRTGNMKN